MSGMSMRLNQTGIMNTLVVPLTLITLLFVGAASFGFWAFSERQVYKNKSDERVAEAVKIAKQEEGLVKDKAYAEAEKNPLITYEGPAAFGSVKVTYPKTWSSYVHSLANDQPLDAFFSPRTVTSVVDIQSIYTLRVRVVQQTYASSVKAVEGQVQTKLVTAVPFALPQVPDQIGVKLEGQIDAGKKVNGIKLILPLRDKTLEIWTENPQAIGDFNNIIIPNFKYSP